MINNDLLCKGKKEKKITIKVNGEYITYKCILKNEIKEEDLKKIYNDIYIGINYLYSNYINILIPYEFIKILNNFLLSDIIDLTELSDILENTSYIETYSLAIKKFLTLFNFYQVNTYIYDEKSIISNTKVAKNIRVLSKTKIIAHV